MAEPTLPSKEEMADMEAHVDESKQTDIFVCCIVCLAAGVTAIGLRVWGRLISTGRIDLSDWLAVVALIGLLGYLTCVLILRDNYLGRHVILLTEPTQKETFAKAHMGSVATFAISMSFIKCSVARTYWTIFPQRKFRWALLGVVGFMVGWMISATLVGIFQCTPIAFAWDKTVEGGTCIDFALFVLISACKNVFTDIVILILPIPLVTKLNVSKRKNAAIVGIVRIPYSTQVDMVADVIWNNVPSGMLLGIELTVAIFSACLPTFVPLYRTIFKKDLLSDGSHPTSHGNASRRANTSIGRGTGQGRGMRVTEDIKTSSQTRRLDTWHRISEDDESLALRGDDSSTRALAKNGWRSESTSVVKVGSSTNHHHQTPSDPVPFTRCLLSAKRLAVGYLLKHSSHLQNFNHFSPTPHSRPGAGASRCLLLASHLPKKLDGHAQRHQPTASNDNPHEQNPKAASWDPFLRYHSDANSFPDYRYATAIFYSFASASKLTTAEQRVPRGKMGRNNVKGLNRLGGAVNTVSSTPGTRIRPKQTVTPTQQPRKIRRLGPSPTEDGTTSRYFPKHYEIEDGTPEDPYEIKTSNHSSPVRQQGLCKSPPKPGLLITQASRKRKSVAGFPDSPDVLTIEDLEEPPPAQITSDITSKRGARKRARQSSFSEAPFKRPKAVHSSSEVVDSEDELQAGPRDVKAGRIKKTNFSTIGAHNVRRASSKADIVPARFGSSPKPKQALQQRASPRMRGKPVAIEKAVSGWCTWASNEAQQAWLIPHHRDDGSVSRYDPVLLDRSSGEPLIDKVEVDQPVLDLQLRVDKILNVDHLATKSLFVRIKRSLSIHPSSAPIVCLKFQGHADTLEFLGNIPDSVCTEAESVESLALEKTFENVMTKAERQAPARSSKASASSTPRSQLVVKNTEKPSGEGAPPVKKEKLADKMRRSHQDSNARNMDVDESPKSPPVQVTSRPNTRRTRRSSPGPAIRDDGFPEGWTLKNPGWRDRWQKSLVYPATGKNRATVDADDIARLDEGEFLNDNIISFYLRYLQVKLEQERPEILKKVYIFSSFFFEKLKTSRDRYEGVKSWTAKVDLLSYDYIVVPVNENAHWYLAIICNIAKALPDGEDSPSKGEEKEDPYDVDAETSASSRMPAVEKGVKTISLEDDSASSPETLRNGDPAPDSSAGNRSVTVDNSSPPKSKGKKRKSMGAAVHKFDPKEPRIITLDSLGSAHSPTCTILRTYLRDEARDKKKVELTSLPGGMTGKGIPEQDNYCDCGVFVLGYMEEFLKDPDESSRRLLQKEKLNWQVRPSQLRSNIRELLFTLQEEQQQRLFKERQEKKNQRRRQMEAKAKSTESPTPARPSASQEPKSRQSVDESRKTSPSTGPADQPAGEPVEKALTPEQAPEPKIPDSLRINKTTSVVNDEPMPKLVTRLKDSESVSSKGDSPESYYSAPTSPGNVEAKIEHHQAAKSKAAPKESTPLMVEKIPSSDAEGEKGKNKASVRPSIEIDDGDEVVAVKSPKRSKEKKSPSKINDLTRDDVQASKSKTPRYERIDRSGS